MCTIPLVWLGLLATTADAAQLVVCDDDPQCYSTIQAAVYAAQPLDEILVRAGNWYGNVRIEGQATIVGDGQGVVNVYGTTGDAVFDIDTEQPVFLSGMTIDGSEVRRCVYVGGGDLTMEFLTCRAAAANGNGGGLLALDSEITGNSVTFIENWAESDGGSIYLGDESVLTLDSSTIFLSQADRGGGIFVDTDSELIASDTVFQENDARDDVGPAIGFHSGGSIFAHQGVVTLENSTVTSSFSNENGGGIGLLYSELYLSYGSIDNNWADGSGGAIDSLDSAIDIDGTTFDGNWAAVDGGGVNLSGGALWATDLGMSLNTASWGDGGGIHADMLADLDLVNADFVGNVTWGLGGSIAASWANTFVLEGGLHFNNEAVGGGAVSTWDDGYGRDFVINGVLFEQNLAWGTGGAVTHEGFLMGLGVELVIQDSDFIGNDSVVDGGAVSSSNAGGLIIEDCSFIQNSADQGGAINIRSVRNAKLTRNYLCQNEAWTAGGGVRMDGGGDPKYWTSNIFSGNSATDNGGGIWMSGMQAMLVNNTLAGNWAGYSGGGAYVSSSTLEWVNNLTMATPSGDGLTLVNSVPNGVSNNAWWNNTQIDTNLDPAVRLSDIVLPSNDPPVVAYTGSCESDDFTIIWEGDLFDAGDPNRNDPDGGNSDIGAFGGENADGDAWNDEDGDGVANMWDCNDGDASQGPRQAWYPDEDDDGFGDESARPLMACGPPDNDGRWVNDGGDCDDGESDIHPGADEWCDDIDSDCDGETFDPESLDATIWYPDNDGDGWGAGEAFRSCDPGDGFSEISGDCNDDEGNVNPNAQEIWYDGIDQDCDGASDFDQDLDGFDSAEHLDDGDDCDDLDDAAYPEAPDGFGDDVDQDCNGVPSATWMNGGGGCGCDSNPASGPGWLLILLATFLVRSRGQVLNNSSRTPEDPR